MRAFRYIPVSLKYDPVFNSLSSFIRDLFYSAVVAQDDRHCLPFDAATLRCEIFPARPRLTNREIALARDVLLAKGLFIRKQTVRKDWLEIAAEYRHEEGRKETSFGDERLEPVQAELCMPVEMRFDSINGSRTGQNKKESLSLPSGDRLRQPGRSSAETEVPSWPIVKAHADLIGLAEWKALDWFHEMEAVGWIDRNRRPILKWQPLLSRIKTQWEADGRPVKPPSFKPSQPSTYNSQNRYGPNSHPGRGRNVSDEMRSTASEYAAG